MENWPMAPSPATAPSAAPTWHRFYGDLPAALSYPRCTLYQAIHASVQRHSDAVACEFLGTTMRYRELGETVDRVAAVLAGLGVRPGDRLLIALPTTPQAVAAYYACRSLGAVAVIVHPLAAATELERCARETGAAVGVGLDTLYQGLRPALESGALRTLLLTRLGDGLSPLRRLGFGLTRGRKPPRVPRDSRICWWTDQLRRPHPSPPRPSGDSDTVGTILFSGGTTGLPKGILLSDRNILSEALQLARWIGMREGDRVLAALPLFHGFGLSALVNAPLLSGCRVILVPQFTPETVARVIRRSRPNFIAGVPSLFDALSRGEALRRVDLSCITAAFSGGDTLPARVKERFDRLLAESGSRTRLLEGYGLTESVTAAIVMPLHHARAGSIGIPLPDTLATIRDPESGRESMVGESGEICISGPSVMLGYLNDPTTTERVLRRHEDDRIWLHTGDIGRRDEDGFFYFLGRRKRMIKTAGFNVFPAEVEQVLCQHREVAEAYVLGVPDEYRGQRVKAYVVPADRSLPGAEVAGRLMDHCRTRLNWWSCPGEIEIRPELPKNRIGKVDERALVEGVLVGATLR
jgi:long-chain acyl-CoA synthetase